jgi:hypothetical protein
MQKLNALEILGWFGGLVLILAYALNSTNVIDSQTLTYQGLNLTGSLALAYYTFRKKAYPNVALNLIWAGVGVFAIVGILSGKGKPEKMSFQAQSPKMETADWASKYNKGEGMEYGFLPKTKKVKVPNSFQPFNLFHFNLQRDYFLPKICWYRAGSFSTLMASSTSGSRSRPICTRPLA